MEQRTLFFLVGATASGKSRVALEVAPRLGAEILSMDSMTVYRGMDIGTAKPAEAQRQHVRHHLLDLVDPDRPFNVADYVRAADTVLEDLAQRKVRGLFVGGTALYLKALISGLFEGPGQDEGVRRRLIERAEHEGSQALHAELTQLDPDASGRIHPNDVKRVVRALEVLEVTGRPISAWQTQWTDQDADRPHVIVGLAWERAELYRRIDRRVQEMFQGGLVEEVRGLLDRCGALGPTACQAVGYAEVVDYVQGNTTLPETIQLVQTHTRQFAKRQLTWFRRFPEIRWVQMAPQESGEAAADRVLSALDAES